MNQKDSYVFLRLAKHSEWATRYPVTLGITQPRRDLGLKKKNHPSAFPSQVNGVASPPFRSTGLDWPCVQCKALDHVINDSTNVPRTVAIHWQSWLYPKNSSKDQSSHINLFLPPLHIHTKLKNTLKTLEHRLTYACLRFTRFPFSLAFCFVIELRK